MDKIPKPPLLILDPNDENIILEVPEETVAEEVKKDEASLQKEKKVNKHDIIDIKGSSNAL